MERIFQNLPSGVLIDIKSQFKMIPPFFCAIFCEKIRYFWSKPIKQLDWRKKNETIVNMIAKVFNHQLFWKKNWKSIKSLFTFFKKFQLFCYCFDSCLPQTLLSIRTMTLRNNEKKTTEAKKEKGGPLNCFLWQVAFMQRFFLTYVPHYYAAICLLPFP